MLTSNEKLICAVTAKRRGKQPLSLEARTLIIAQAIQGERHKDIAARFGCHRNTVSNLVSRYYETGTIQTVRPPSRKPILNNKEKRILYRIVRKMPRIH
ncbi:hypothetical protein F4775DRAFT_548043 [Biscogniauxia sp. FL1348]|nr:hypothetical protein F4775DRAFT_548043 [Biscogniauxia sp. FL1348]